MFYKSNFSVETAVANQSGAMETDTISKNGRSSKSQMSRVNFLVIACFALGVVFGGCNKEDENGKTFTVIFDSNGGSSVETKTVKGGEKVTKPSPDPLRNGYIFAAWYREITLNIEWKFDIDVVTADMALYAKWTREPQQKPSDGTYTKENSGGYELIISGSETEMEIASGGTKYKGTLSFDEDAATFTFTTTHKWVSDSWVTDPDNIGVKTHTYTTSDGPWVVGSGISTELNHSWLRGTWLKQ
jgi:uncharacterized repeat protein (TIGR02543 family)